MAGRKLVLEGEISIKSFILGLSVLIIPLIRTSFGHIDWVFDYLTGTPGKVVIAVYIAVTNGLLLVVYKGPLYKVRLRAAPPPRRAAAAASSPPPRRAAPPPRSAGDARCSERVSCWCFVNMQMHNNRLIYVYLYTSLSTDS